jgi:hypothetical protein
MALVHKHSCECIKSELDLFGVPPTQTSVESGVFVEHNTTSAIADNAPLEFCISGSGDDYIDVSQILLHVTAKIVRDDGTNIAADAAVAPVNLWLQSLFSQVDIKLNDTLITQSTNTYPYRAYLETLLSYGEDAKVSHLTASLFYKDTANHFEDVAGDENAGFVTRKAFTAASRHVDMMGRIHADLFFQDRYLINGVDMKIRLVRSKDSFALMAPGADAYKVKITDASLFVRKVKLNSAVQLAHIKALENTNVKYPIRRVETKVFSVPRGNLAYIQENLFLGQLPKRIVIGLVDSDAFNGLYAKNPFNFKNYGINFFALYVDGHQLPAKPYTPNFERNRYMRSYIGLFVGSGKMNHDEGNSISRLEYAGGYTLFAFDLTPDMSEAGHFNLIKTGNIRLEIHFSAALDQTINCLAYAEYDSVLEIDKHRSILFDYAP